MDPIAFPPQIREYFLGNTNGKNDEDQLTKLFKENKSVKEEYIAWAQQHETTVYNIPRLHQTLDIAIASDAIDNEDVEWHGIANTINQIFHYFKNNLSSNVFLSMIMSPEELKTKESYQLITDYPKEYFETVFNLAEAGIIDKKQQMDALLVKNPANNIFVLSDGDLLKEAMPFLLTMDDDDLVDLFLTKNNNEPSLFDSITHNWNTQDPEIFLSLVSFLGEKDKLPPHPELSEAAGRCFLKLYNRNLLQPDDIIDHLSMRLSKGTLLTAVHDSVIPFLKKLDAKEYINILSKEKDLGIDDLRPSTLRILYDHTTKGFLESKTITDFLSGRLNGYVISPTDSILASLLYQLDSNDLVAIFSAKNDRGETPLHRPELINNYNIYTLIMEWFKELSEDSQNQLLSVQDNAGNTPLHNAEIYKKTSGLIGKLAPLLEIRNEAGFKPLEYQKIKLSPNWVVKDKIETDSKTLTEAEYGEKVKTLVESVNTLWDSFVFGDDIGDISKEYLMLEVEGKTKTYTPGEIKEALDVMLDKMINKTSWLGTPNKDDTQGLLQFYSQMLNNFDKITSNLNEKDPKEKAGTIIGIAKVHLEGRCAAAYQSEIEQAKMLLVSSQEGLGLDASFEKMARNSLLGTIEDIVRRDYNGDSHVFSQMLFSVGMAPSADPLFLRDALYLQLEVQDCHEKILAEWTKDKVIADLTDSLKRIDNDQLQDWFRSFTPEGFGQELKVKQNEIKSAEQAIILESSQSLAQKGLTGVLNKSVLKVFQSTQALSLRIIPFEKKYVSNEVLERLNQATTPQEFEEARSFYNVTDRSVINELNQKEFALRDKPSLTSEEKNTLDAITKERKSMLPQSMELTREYNTLEQNAQARLKLADILRLEKTPVTNKELDIIVAEKQIFERKLRTLAEGNEIDYNPSETGLPSNNLEYKRQADFAAQFFSENDGKLNMRGAVEIAQHIGVLVPAPA